jgi:3-dehydro-L-gulonate 2-dehydrogenase
MKLTYEQMSQRFASTLQKYGFDAGEAETIADIFTETTFDGVFSHGINRFPRFIGDVISGIVLPGAVPTKNPTGGPGAFEQWEGNRGPGISNALFCTGRAIRLARAGGIGCVGLRNTNHWMRGGTYGLHTARLGLLFIGWTNTIPNMPPWNGRIPTLGNNPFVMAIPYKKGPVVLDMAMSLYSYGKLEWHQRKGLSLGEYGGFDQQDRLTRDPSEILRSGRILPTGLWKGSAFAMVLDLAAAIISGGYTSREIGTHGAETALSQVFIAIDPSRYMSADQMEAMVEQSMDAHTGSNPGTRFPGQRSSSEGRVSREEGIEVPDALWEEILTL